VGVEIAQQQDQLEKQHAGRPNGCRATKPRQNHLANQGLYLEQQEGAEENGEAVMKGQAQVNFHVLSC